MSRLRANQITNENANGAPNFPHGLTVTGIVTATTSATTMSQIVVGSAVTANSQGIDVTGIVTATSFKGAATNLTSIPAANLTGTAAAINGSNITNLPAANLTGALPAISGANLTGLSPGITNAQQFRLAASQAGSGSAGTVLTNWQNTMTTYEAIGSNWSQSSGIFSCSATGIYLCHWVFVVNNTSTGDAFDPNIQISVNSGGAYTTRSRSWAHVNSSTTPRDSPANSFMFDVTDTSTFRLRFRQSQDNDCASGTTIGGSTSENLTNIMFIRLGDT